MLEAKLWYNKTETKNERLQRWSNLSNTLVVLILVIFSAPYPFSHWGKNRLSENAVWEEWEILSYLWGNDKNMGESFARGMSKNEQILLFDSQMYLQVILTP